MYINNNFISKLETVNYYIGSFDANIELSKKLIMANSNISKNEVLEEYSKYYNIPKLQMPFTIKYNNKAIGIIGLNNLLWSNRRANLNIFLDKNLSDVITHKFIGYLIDEYINYVHKLNVHNITLSVNASNKKLLDILNYTSMNYYGQVPYSAKKL